MSVASQKHSHINVSTPQTTMIVAVGLTLIGPARQLGAVQHQIIPVYKRGYTMLDNELEEGLESSEAYVREIQQASAESTS